MPVLLVLVIVLPPALLVLGLALGVAGVRWWTARAGGAGGCRRAQPQDEEAAMAALQAGCDTTVPSSTAPSSIVLPQGRKGSAVGTAAPPAFQLVASCGSLQPLSRSSDAPSEACLPLALRLAAPSPLRYSGVSQPGSPAGAAAASLHRGGLAGLALAGSASSLSPGGGDVGHRKTLSLELGQLMRAGPSAISQVRGGGRGGASRAASRCQLSTAFGGCRVAPAVGRGRSHIGHHTVVPVAACARPASKHPASAHA